MQMKKIIRLSIFCLLVPAAAFADTPDILAANNQIAARSISTNVNYTETGNGILGTQTGTLDTETGAVPGYALSVSAMHDWLLGNDYFAAEYDYSSGHTNYAGALCTPAGVCGAYGSYLGTSSAVLSNFSFRYGSGFSLKDEFMLTPYAEFGHHEWDRGVNYGEIYTHNWLGIGALGQYSPARKLVLTAEAMIGETVGSYISVNAGPGFSGFSSSLGNSTLYKVGISADYAFARHLHGNIGFDFTGFKYGMSAIHPVVINGINNVAWEPDSKTNYTALKAGLGYAF